MLSALSNFDNPSPALNRHTGGLDADLFAELSMGKAAPANPLRSYALPPKMARATTHTAREVCLELLGECVRGVRLSSASRAALHEIDVDWPPEAPALSALNASWLAVVSNGSASTSVAALYKTISSVLKAMKEEGGARNVDEALKRINAKSASLQHCVAVLRTLSSQSHDLGHWKALREDVRRAVEMRKDQLKVQPAVFMRGLWEDE